MFEKTWDEVEISGPFRTMDREWARGADRNRYVRLWRARRRGDVLLSVDGTVVGYLSHNRTWLHWPDGTRVGRR